MTVRGWSAPVKAGPGHSGNYPAGWRRAVPCIPAARHAAPPGKRGSCMSARHCVTVGCADEILPDYSMTW